MAKRVKRKVKRSETMWMAWDPDIKFLPEIWGMTKNQAESQQQNHKWPWPTRVVRVKITELKPRNRK